MTDLTMEPRGSLIPDLVGCRVRGRAAAVAVLDGGREITYGDLDRSVNQLAHLLRERGAGTESLVGVLLPRSAAMIVSLLGIWRAGAAYVPLGPDDPAARTEATVRHCGAGLVVTDAAGADRVRAAGAEPVILDAALDVLSGQPGTPPDLTLRGDQAAYAIYTSGSTGAPKGVLISHAGIANRVAWTVHRHRIDPADRVVQKTPLTFDAAGWEVFAPLVSGGTLVLAPPGAERDPALLVATVAAHRVTVLQVVPSTLRALVAEPGWAGCTALRLLFSAGEALHAELVQRFLERAEEAGAEPEVWNTYGPTECSIDVTAHRFDPIQSGGPVPIGAPIDGLRIVLARPDGTLAGPGEEGELCAGGIGLARGYLNAPGLTADRFVPDPAGPAGSRLYRTGDLARRRADGGYDYLGRVDHQLKVNGVRIEPGEVEAALAAHPGVGQAAAAGFRTGDGSTRLAAYVEATDAVTDDDLIRFLGDRLPAPLIPAAFVRLPTLPTTSSGKIDRRALPDPARQSGATTVPTGTEQVVADAWQEILGVDEVRRTDDFFRLGGSSLQLNRLANRLRNATGREVPLAQLFTARTVRAQAALLDAAGPAPRPVSRPAGAPAVVSPGQRRLWLMDRLQPSAREWVTGVFLDVPGGAPQDLVTRALAVLVAAHETLRTRFRVVGGEPVPVVDPAGPVPTEVVEDDRARFAAAVDELADRGFDLEHGPLVRAVLGVHPDGSTTLVLLMPHIAADGWSAAVLRRQFTAVMTSLLAGAEPALLAPAMRYADYAAWQTERLASGALEPELAYWRAALDGAQPLVLPTDHARPATRDGRGAAAPVRLPAGTARALVELGREADATPFMTLLTGFATVLARYTGQWDVVVGAPVAGRDLPELEGVVGFFLNNLVLRCQLHPGMCFGEAVRRVRDVCRAAFAHRELPFDRLVAEVAPDRDLSRTPLYQVAFDFHDARLIGSPDAGPQFDTLVDVTRSAKTDLTLYLREQHDGGFAGILEYATALFDAATVERMAGHLERLLSAAAEQPDRPIGELPLLDAAEERHLAATAGSPARVTESVPQRIAAAVRSRPDAIAVVADDATLTYAQLDARAEGLARRLRELGAGPERRVAVLLDRGAALPVALLAAWKSGAAYLPLDPGQPAEHVGFVLRDASVAVLVSESGHLSRLAGAMPAGTGVLDVAAGDVPAVPGTDPACAPDLDSLAYIIYTSGSTGRPKGVLVTHRGVANHIAWAVDTLCRGPGGSALFSSVAFDLVVPNIWAPLAAGRPLRLLPADLDLTELGDRLAAGGPYAFLKMTPGHFDILSEQLAPERVSDLAGVIVVAGESLPVPLAVRGARALGPGRLINEYGPTEASVGTSTLVVDPAISGTVVPIGTPLPGMTMQVLDDRLRRLPVGVPGELYVGGAGVARGYGGRPAATAQAFVPDPYGAPGSRLYRTGDIVRLLPSGAFDFLGRRDAQVKIRGYRVEPGEAAAVLREHDAVRDAVVVADRGPTGPRLVAYCVAEPGADPAAEDFAVLRHHCAQRLPEYLVPAVFVPIDHVPLTANGKLDRVRLPELVVTVPAFTAPDGPAEERIAEIFAELLGTPVSADSNFFTVGGNSILAIRLIAAIQTAFDVTVPVRAVFEGPTVAELAKAVEAEIHAELDAMSDAEVRIASGQPHQTRKSRPTAQEGEV